MHTLIGIAGRIEIPAGWLSVVLDAAAKGSLLFLVAIILTYALRRAPAAARHTVWSIALACQLLLPVLSAVLPQWSAPVLPAGYPVAASWEKAAAPMAARIGDEASGGVGMAPDLSDGSIVSEEVSASLAGESITPLPRSAGDSGNAGLWITLAWLAGVLAVVLRLAIGTLQVAWFARQAVRVTDPDWLSLAQRVALQFDVQRPLTLLCGSRLSVPVTWGILYPVVLLPTDADQWDEERRRVVLLHEVAHIKRLDALTQLFSQLALALFWFNPLLWMAIRRMRVERERACDDYVLNAGTKPSEYVHHLVDIVRSLGPTTGPAFAALAMARRSEFEGRMLAVLDPGSRRHASRRTITASAYAAVLVLLALPLAALRPIPQADAHSAGALPLSRTARAEAPAASWGPEDSPGAVSFGRGGNAVPDFRWAGLLSTGQSIEVKGASGDISAVPAAGDSVEVLARIQAPEGRSPEVEMRIVNHPGGVTICAVYPSPDPDRPNTCAPGDGMQDNREGKLDDVHFVVRVPRGVRFIGRTVSGDVKATSLEDDVSGHTISGNVTLSTSGFADATTVSGDVVAEIGRTDWENTLTLRTVSGNVTALLPPGASTVVHAEVESGVIDSEFTLSLEPLGEHRQRVTGVIGVGGRVLDLQTKSGRISLRRHSPIAGRTRIP